MLILFALIVQSGKKLFNIISKEIESSILSIGERGLTAFKQFVEERIPGTKSLWHKMTKMKNLRWSDTCKEVKVKVCAQDVCIKAANSLFARLLIVARSSREKVDLKEAIGTHEFSMIN